MLESEVEKHLRRRVESLGGVAVKLEVRGTRGWPDRLVLLPGGRAAFVELKRPRKAKGTSAHQDEKLGLLRLLGFEATVLDTKEKIDDWVAEERS